MNRLIVNKYNKVILSGSYSVTLKREHLLYSVSLDRTYDKITEHKSYDVPQMNKINQGDAISIDYMGKIEPLSLIADNTNRFAGFALDLPIDYQDSQMRLATKGIILIDIDQADTMTPERFSPKNKEVYAISRNRFTFDKKSYIQDKHSPSKQEVNNLYIGNVLELVEVKNENNFAPNSNTKYMYSVVFQAQKQYEYVEDTLNANLIANEIKLEKRKAASVIAQQHQKDLAFKVATAKAKAAKAKAKESARLKSVKAEKAEQAIRAAENKVLAITTEALAIAKFKEEVRLSKDIKPKDIKSKEFISLRALGEIVKFY